MLVMGTRKMPRMNDRPIDENGLHCRITSKVLPPYLRLTKSLDELIPWLHLKGISTGDFSETSLAVFHARISGYVSSAP